MSVWIVATIIAATLERWWFPEAWNEAGLPASRFYFGDTRAFLGYGQALATGQLFDNGVPFHPPGWPLVLSLIFRAAGWSSDVPPDPLVLKHLGAVISGASVGLAALLGYVIGGRGVMVVTSLLGTFHFGHLVQAAAPNSEPLFGLLMIVALLLAVQQRPNGIVLGVVSGLASLVRAEFLLCAALLAVWLATDRSRPAQYGRAILFATGFMVTLLPSTIVNWRNIEAFNRTRVERMPGPLPTFAPITSYGAFNFANANHGRAEGGFNWDLPSLEPSTEEAALLEAGQLDLARPAVYDAYVHGYRMGATWLLSNPASAIALAWKKLAIALSVFDYGYLFDNRPIEIRGTRRAVDQLDLPTSWLSLVHGLLVAAGIWIAAQNRSSRVLLFPMITLLISSLLFFGYVRLGVAYLPLFWILQALAITTILGAMPLVRQRGRQAEFAAVALAAVLLVAEWSAAGRQRLLMIDGLVDEEGRLVEDQAMEIRRAR